MTSRRYKIQWEKFIIPISKYGIYR
jgi:hypothetical protein